nr:efflux RND transporter permease subunit [Lachnospiraceae bacterium]
MISKYSVKKPYSVLVGVILAIVLGVVAFTKSTVDLLPNISLPYIIVMTTYPGASPETVEMVVTQPVEAGMATVSNIENVSSVSNENYSVVILEFAQSSDMDAVSLEIREKLDQIKSYWDDSVGNPIILKLNPNMLPTMIAAVGIDGMGAADTAEYVRDKVVPEIESVEGVANVTASGMVDKSINVIIRQEKIDAVNNMIRGAIDNDIANAKSKLDESRQTVLDGMEEIDSNIDKLSDGKSEISSGERQISSGERTLNSSMKTTQKKLGEAMEELLTAKTELEATKMHLSADLETAKTLDDSLRQLDSTVSNIKLVTTAHETYNKAFNMLTESVSNCDASGQNQAKQAINTLKASYFANTLLTQAAAKSKELSATLNSIKNLDWNSGDYYVPVYGALSAIAQSIPNALAKQGTDIDKLTAQRDEVYGAYIAITGGLDYASYKNTIDKTIQALDQKISLVDDGVVEATSGQIEAAVKLAASSAEISLNEYKLEMAKKEIENAQTKLEEARKQLEDALKEIEEGEEKIEEGRQEAYDKANAENILTVDMVKNLLAAQNFSMPAGYVNQDADEYLVRVGDKVEDVDALRKLPLIDMHLEGVDIIRLESVADVFYTDNSADVYTNVNGTPGVILMLQKQTGYSTKTVADSVKKKFDELLEDNDDLSLVPLMDQGVYIKLIMDSIINNILLGALLSIIILLMFLKDIRPTLVVAISIPVSLVTAVVCMYFAHISLNLISLSGLALGIGMLVDNSIVVIENIFRLKNEGVDYKQAAIKGAAEVAGAIMASTLTTICVFLPIVFTEGITRQLFVDMGLTIAFVLLASLLISVTVVPAMAAGVMKNVKEKPEGNFYKRLIRGYEKVLRWCLEYKGVIFILSLTFLAASFIGALSNGTAFMTDMDSTQMTVTVSVPDAETLEDVKKASDKVIDAIRDIDEVEDVGATLAADTMSMMMGSSDSSGITESSIYVVCNENKKRSLKEIAEDVYMQTAGINAVITVNTQAIDMSAMYGSGLEIIVKGRDMDKLEAAAKSVASTVSMIEGCENVDDGIGSVNSEYRISIDKDTAVKYGLTVAQVFAQINSALSDSPKATALTVSGSDTDVYINADKYLDISKESLGEILIDGTDKEQKNVKVPLWYMARFEETHAPRVINREDQTRYIKVTAEIGEGYNIGLISPLVEKALEEVELPKGITLEYSGENKAIMDALKQVLLMLILAIVFMYLIMVAQFQSLKHPFIIMFTIPLAFTGGFLALFLSHNEISVLAMIGFVMLSGIIVNNGIVLVDYMNKLGETSDNLRENVVKGGKTRLRPVLMTALTTILALSTMVFSREMGADMARPMALVTIGGLVYGTLLTLFVIPCIYEVFNKKREKKPKREKRRRRKKKKSQRQTPDVYRYARARIESTRIS